MTTEAAYEQLVQSIIERGLIGENALPVMARMAQDPGPEYFSQLKADLKKLFDLLGESKTIDRALAAALFGVSHQAYVHYEAAIQHGVTFRDSLVDPDLIDLEMAVESIFTGDWITL